MYGSYFLRKKTTFGPSAAASLVFLLQLQVLPHLNDRQSVVSDIILCDDDSSDIIIFWNLVHDIQHEFFDDRAKRSRPRIFFHRLLGNGLERSIFKLQIHLIQCQQLLVLF